MKLEALKRRLDKRRPMAAVSMRFPADILEDLKRVAPLRGSRPKFPGRDKVQLID